MGVLSPLTRACDRAWHVLRGSRTTSAPEPLRCTMIVCPPRSGGTVIYQALAAALPCAYLSNTHALFPYSGTRLLRRRRPQDCSPSYRSYCGHTAGWLGVYEGNEFLEWAHRSVALAEGEERNRVMRQEFLGLAERLAPAPGETVLLKNARAYDRVAALHEAVPEIVFVRVRREREQVVQSVLHAYHELGSFHPVPPAMRGWTLDDPLKFACTQIAMIEAELDVQFSKLPAAAQLEIPYEGFCERPLDFIMRLAVERLHLSPDVVRNHPALALLRASRTHKVTDAEARRIRDWRPGVTIPLG